MSKRIALRAAAALMAAMPMLQACTTNNSVKLNYVAVHDPSIVIGYEADGKVTADSTAGSRKIYCIFGSHRAWTKSYDLQNWEMFSNNINDSFTTIFAPDTAWSANGSDKQYNVHGNLWAPDVVWNPTMGKWCMYMSVNGNKWFSSIVLLTAESLTGDWTRVGTVVYSGFTPETFRQTDVPEILGTDTLPDNYMLMRNGGRAYGLNAIDPCAFFDNDGNMWMTYGSWFGGIYMLRLDPATGLRDRSYTYATVDGTAENATSDAYMGLKIAGGNHVSGEASYIKFIDGKYRLFMTNGELQAAGGYNMRVFSSDSVTGPYRDLAGHDARYSPDNTVVGSINGNVGTRLMSYYKWSFMPYGFVAQGHNSVIVDTDGKIITVYHTRFDDGTEWHQVRVHQLFATANGALTAAPFEYRGEALQAEPFATNDIAGNYSIINHGTGTDFANKECAQEQPISLTADGKVTGSYSGSWMQSAASPQMTITIDGNEYCGVFVEQYIEGTNTKTLCFTAVSSTTDTSVWGYKLAD